MTSTVISVAVGPEQLATLHARAMPQKDNLCGCFWGAIALAAAGVTEWGGDPIDEDLVAVEAGTLLPDGDPRTFVPPGEEPRRDYRLELPAAPDPGSSGTSVAGLVQALERLGGPLVELVAVAGPWNAATAARLVDATAETSPETTLLANIRTGPLWGSHAHPSAVLAVLEGSEVAGPPADWDVGHFVNLAATVRGTGGSAVVVRDSYRSLGADGYHIQPASALANALLRRDGREGGVLCICPSGGGTPLGDRLQAEGFELRPWDNGTALPV